MDPIERRRTRRRPVGDNRARLEWSDGPDFVDTPARLIDVSQGGAGFVAERPPPPGRPVWVRLEAPSLTGWVSAQVVRLGESRDGGLCFAGAYPHELIAGLI